MAGSTTGVIGGDVVVIADPNANNDPVTVVVPETGEINIASGTPGADYIIEGIGDAIIRVGNAIDADGNVLLAAGSTYQVDNDYEGTVIVNLDGAICDSVDINIITTTGIIASALPQSLSELERDFQFILISTSTQVLEKIKFKRAAAKTSFAQVRAMMW